MAHSGQAGRYRRWTGVGEGLRHRDTPPGDAPAASRHDREKVTARIDTLAALVLSIAAVATAWSAYQSARWNGVMAGEYNRASAARTESVRADTAAGQATIVDITLAADWANAQLSRNQELADDLRDRMSPQLTDAMNSWLADWQPGMPLPQGSPFSAGRYTAPGRDRAVELENQAAATYANGSAANQRSDNYVLTGVLFALSLFFAGISSRVRGEHNMARLVYAATALAVIGLLLLGLQPKTVSV